MDNRAFCEPSWQRSGPERETAERVKTPRPCWKSSTFHCFNLNTRRSPVEISKRLHPHRTHMKRPFKAPSSSWRKQNLDVISRSSSSTSLKLLAPSQMHMKERRIKKEGSDGECLHKCWCRRKDERRLSCQRNTGEIPSLCVCRPSDRSEDGC